jgi:hypothetical protein
MSLHQILQRSYDLGVLIETVLLTSTHHPCEQSMIHLIFTPFCQPVGFLEGNLRSGAAKMRLWERNRGACVAAPISARVDHRWFVHRGGAIGERWPG